jgi:two-component system sensor histidine kinase HydH
LALLLKGKFADSSPDRETAGLLVDQVDRMNRTVSELLSFARPTPLQLERVSLKDLLNDILRLMETDAQNNDIVFRLNVAPDLHEIAADRDRLNQVFINLLLNGVQAMDKGGDLYLEAENRDDDKYVEVRVRDTGCGIPPEITPQLFYPYFTTKAGGTGIGLAISQKIINDHKGTIKIDSVEGSGTTVTVVLPVFVGNTEGVNQS